MTILARIFAPLLLIAGALVFIGTLVLPLLGTAQLTELDFWRGLATGSLLMMTGDLFMGRYNPHSLWVQGEEGLKKRREAQKLADPP